MSHKTENTAEGIVLVDPLKPCRIRIQFIQRLIVSVQMKQITVPVLDLLMRLLRKQIPVKLPLFAPLPKLRKLLSHKQQLFARMSRHKCIRRFQICKLVKAKSRHLIEHRALQMHHLIVGQHQNIILTVRILHGKGHLIMRPFPEQRI